MRKALSPFVILAALSLFSCSGPKDGHYSLTLLTTNDVHGTFFDSTYTGGNVRRSLYAVKYQIDSVRRADGEENVILIDAGDIIQGDNAAYYYNYVDTLSPHVYPRMARYMGYDAITLGNHDIETGHAVYDRVAAEIRAQGIPVLAGNAIRDDNGKPYFQTCAVLRRHGLKIAILGYDNANMAAWLPERLWSGMRFASLIPLVQEDVDRVVSKERPHIVIVSVHSGTGDGDGSQLESQGLDLLNTLHGVDFVVCSHDHRPMVISRDTTCLINSGSHSRFVGHGKISFDIARGRVSGKRITADLIPVDRFKTDTAMARMFHADYAEVKRFTTRKVGDLGVDLVTRESFKGMCDYMNLLHTLSLSAPEARISFAAPLTFNGVIKAGSLVYNDLFTVYPFENQLYVLRMTGREIKDYLEASYDGWINTLSPSSPHVFKIMNRGDARVGLRSWSFVNRSYNFDSAGGLFYTVDITKPLGERVSIESFSDGSPFEAAQTYNVAVTSYRASGGGGLMLQAGVDTGKIEERVVAIYPEIRNILYEYLVKNQVIDPEAIGDKSRIGGWRFVPESLAVPALEKDMDLLFGRR